MMVKFWGVRGSIACPGRAYLRYGGNTSCVEVQAAGQRIVLDAGTGFAAFGRQLLADKAPSVTLLLSHTHWDHISGFPFFSPAANPAFRFRIFSGHLEAPYTIQSVLAGQMTYPFFPVPLKVMSSHMTFDDFKVGEALDLGPDLRVRTVRLCHPGRATGYRIEAEGASVCYITDTEHEPGQMDTTIRDFVAGADLMIYDATYTDEEFHRYKGWGHSTWQEAIRVADAAGVRRLALFHHSHLRNDDDMDAIAAAAAAVRPGTFAAREGLCLRLPEAA
ncbi:MAG: MBL fold metallo-hydrolase [Alphaproteobacteria bacterium]